MAEAWMLNKLAARDPRRTSPVAVRLVYEAALLTMIHAGLGGNYSLLAFQIEAVFLPLE